jgi:hypothetical protein
VRQADSIRTFVLQEYIEPARSRGERFVTIRTGDVAKAMGLIHRLPAVCSALRARKFETLAGVKLVKAEGPHQGANLYLTFRLLWLADMGTKAAATPVRVATGQRTGTQSRTLTRMEERCEQLIEGFDLYIQWFDEENIFDGPSLYFHRRTIDALQSHPHASGALDGDCFFILLYATLASWGMHRPGRNSPLKLVGLRELIDSLVAQRPLVERLEGLRLSELSDRQFEEVAPIVWVLLSSLVVGMQQAKLTVNSKALHHLLPDLVPPVDRQYVRRFFYNRTVLGRPEEKTFGEIYPFYHRIAREVAPKFPALQGHGMHTSETKIIDNAIVGYVLAELK